MNDRGADYAVVRDHNRLMVLAYLSGEPGCYTIRKGKKRFAAMRRRGGIPQPSRDGLRLLRLDFLEGMSAPTAVIAVTQQRFDCRILSQRFGGLSRS